MLYLGSGFRMWPSKGAQHGHKNTSGRPRGLHGQRVGSQEGLVIKVTPSGVEVQLALAEGPIRPEGNELIRFDTNGKACDSRDIYRGNWEWDGIPGTLEGGPWHLEDTPFEERKAFEDRKR
jgi:hypothetical protein